MLINLTVTWSFWKLSNVTIDSRYQLRSVKGQYKCCWTVLITFTACVVVSIKCQSALCLSVCLSVCLVVYTQTSSPGGNTCCGQPPVYLRAKYICGVIYLCLILAVMFSLLLLITSCACRVQDTDLSRNIPGKVKVSAPNLHVKHKHK